MRPGGGQGFSSLGFGVLLRFGELGRVGGVGLTLGLGDRRLLGRVGVRVRVGDRAVGVFLHGLAADGAAGGQAEFAGVHIPKIEACCVGESAGEDGVGEEALAVGEAAEAPVSVCFLVVGDAPVAAADVDALGGVLVFGLVVHVDALAGFEVRVSAGGVHDLVDAVDEVLHVRAGAAGGAVPCAGVGDEFVEGLLLGGEALRVGLPDVAEGDLGVGEAAG